MPLLRFHNITSKEFKLHMLSNPTGSIHFNCIIGFLILNTSSLYIWFCHCEDNLSDKKLFERLYFQYVLLHPQCKVHFWVIIVTLKLDLITINLSISKLLYWNTRILSMPHCSMNIANLAEQHTELIHGPFCRVIKVWCTRFGVPGLLKLIVNINFISEIVCIGRVSNGNYYLIL